MTAKKNDITIKLTHDQFREILGRYITPDIGRRKTSLILDILTNHLTDFAKQQLLLAMHEIQETSPYIIGQEVLVDINSLPSWKYDKVTNKEFLVNDTYFHAKVIKIDLYKPAPIEVEFVAVGYGVQAAGYESAVYKESVTIQSITTEEI
jgi:hypothetical protein